MIKYELIGLENYIVDIKNKIKTKKIEQRYLDKVFNYDLETLTILTHEKVVNKLADLIADMVVSDILAQEQEKDEQKYFREQKKKWKK